MRCRATWCWTMSGTVTLLVKRFAPPSRGVTLPPPLLSANAFGARASVAAQAAARARRLLGKVVPPLRCAGDPPGIPIAAQPSEWPLRGVGGRHTELTVATPTCAAAAARASAGNWSAGTGGE